jgi:hypothetical protein
MDADFLQARIDHTKALIVAIEALLLQLAANPTKSFSLNTGQTQESVTQQDIPRLQDMLDGLYNQLCVMEARQNGGAVTVTPAW